VPSLRMSILLMVSGLLPTLLTRRLRSVDSPKREPPKSSRCGGRHPSTVHTSIFASGSGGPESKSTPPSFEGVWQMPFTQTQRLGQGVSSLHKICGAMPESFGSAGVVFPPAGDTSEQPDKRLKSPRLTKRAAICSEDFT